MNYSFMSFSCPDATLPEALELATKFGYGGFEPRVESNHAHGVELGLSPSECKQVRALCEDAGVELCCLALGSSFGDPATAQANVEKTQRYLDLAADLNVRRLRVFGGKVPEGVGREQAAELLVTSLQALAPNAGEKGLSICLETHDDWCHPGEVAGVMKSVNHPAVAVNWDIMHPIRAGGSTMQAAFDTLLPWIKHVHVHDGLTTLETLTMLPMGTGELDNKEAMGLLKGIGYDGYLSGEWIKGTMDEAFFASHLEEEIKVLKHFESEL